ncbi:MAG: hypothetical protein QOG34_828 [Frankiaceae bacterium]|nr:hypothetical protein [Frankiaceae bacterium]
MFSRVGVVELANCTYATLHTLPRFTREIGNASRGHDPSTSPGRLVNRFAALSTTCWLVSVKK